MELHTDRAEEAASRLHRTLAADLFQTSIGNQAFGICLLNPPYDHDPESKRTEHAFLTHSTRYLNDGGLLVFIVPRQRLAVSAKYLASYYYRLRCWAFPHPEREAFRPGGCYRLPDGGAPSRRGGAGAGAGLGRGRAGASVLPRLPHLHRHHLGCGGHPIRHPHRRPGGGGSGGPALRPVGQRRSNGLPLGPARTRGPAP